MGISQDSWHKRRKSSGKKLPIHKKRKYELGRPAANTKVRVVWLETFHQSLALQIGNRRVRLVRVRGGNFKHRALRLDTGNFAWASEGSFWDSFVLSSYVYIQSHWVRVATVCIAELDFENQNVSCVKRSYALWLFVQHFSRHSSFEYFWHANQIAFAGSTRKTRIIDTVYNATSNELVRTKTLVKGAIIAVDATPFRQWYEAHYALPLARKKGAKLSEEEEARLDKSSTGKSTQKKYEKRAKTAAVEQHLIEQFSAGRLLARIASRPGQSGHADGYILEGKELEFYLRKIRNKKAK